jgi:hypothetical protein
LVAIFCFLLPLQSPVAIAQTANAEQAIAEYQARVPATIINNVQSAAAG